MSRVTASGRVGHHGLLEPVNMGSSFSHVALSRPPLPDDFPEPVVAVAEKIDQLYFLGGQHRSDRLQVAAITSWLALRGLNNLT